MRNVSGSLGSLPSSFNQTTNKHEGGEESDSQDLDARFQDQDKHMNKMQEQLDTLKELRLMGYNGASVLEGITKHVNSNLVTPKLRDQQKTLKSMIQTEFKS